MTEMKYHLIPVVSSLALADAERIVEACLAAAREQELLPLTVAVLDSGGHLVIFKPEDGCGIVRADIAIGKAAGALGMGSSGRTLRDRLADRPAFQAAIAAASDGRGSSRCQAVCLFSMATVKRLVR